MFKYLFFAKILLFLSVTVFAQEHKYLHFWGIKAGYLYSDTQLKANRNNFVLLGIRPSNGYYIGGYYQRLEGKKLRTRFDFSYQIKGHSIHGSSGEVVNNQYHYLGVTPTIGYLIFKNTCIYIGPEANLLIAKNTTWKETTFFETGIIGRIGYEYKKIGINLAYFRGISKYQTYQTYAGTQFSRPTTVNFF